VPRYAAAAVQPTSSCRPRPRHQRCGSRSIPSRASSPALLRGRWSVRNSLECTRGMSVVRRAPSSSESRPGTSRFVSTRDVPPHRTGPSPGPYDAVVVLPPSPGLARRCRESSERPWRHARATSALAACPNRQGPNTPPPAPQVHTSWVGLADMSRTPSGERPPAHSATSATGTYTRLGVCMFR
jgi:hypothetical protein